MSVNEYLNKFESLQMHDNSKLDLSQIMIYIFDGLRLEIQIQIKLFVSISIEEGCQKSK